MVESTSDDRSPSQTGPVMTLVALMLAGEAIFGLPFHVARYFRPSFVDVFEVTQTQLGWMSSLYGIVATGCYLLGGRLADQFSPRSLLSFSLVITGLSGFYMMTIPPTTGLALLYVFWGCSTILPFWASLIKATRDWGGADGQGKAFGLLDAGRGLLAAVLATFALLMFRWTLPDLEGDVTLQQKRSAIQITIATYIAACFVAAVMVAFFLPRGTRRADDGDGEVPTNSVRPRAVRWTDVIAMPVVWLQAGVIVAAYMAFKGLDYYSQYAKDIWGWSDVDASTLSTMTTWTRPFATVVAGLIADRVGPSRTVIASFGVLAAGSILLISLTGGNAEPMDPTGGVLPLEQTVRVADWRSSALALWTAILVGCLGIFALRGIYFALLEESEVPVHVTGTAVGVVSFIGYTPEIFFPFLSGWLIDSFEGGIGGYRYLYGIIALACAAGAAAAWQIRIRSRQTVAAD